MASFEQRNVSPPDRDAQLEELEHEEFHFALWDEALTTLQWAGEHPADPSAQTLTLVAIGKLMAGVIDSIDRVSYEVKKTRDLLEADWGRVGFDRQKYLREELPGEGP